VAYRVDDGTLAWTSARSWSWLSQVQWLRDGKSLLAIATPDGRPAVAAQVWIVPYPKGNPHTITNDRSNYRILGLTADGESLLTIPTNFRSDMWSFSLSEPGPGKRISATRSDGFYGFDFTPDGRIIFQTLDRGKNDLAIMNMDGSDRRLITDDPDDDRYPQVTADGRLLYISLTSSGPELRISELDGSQRQTITNVSSPEVSPSISSDGKWAIVPRDTEGVSGLWRVPLDGGPLRQLVGYGATLPAISPDGTRLAFYFPDVEAGTFKIGVVPIEGGEREVELTVAAIYGGSTLRWAEDGEALIINTMPSDRANIWRLPLDGSPPLRITDFTDQRAYWFDYAPDGETLIVTRGVLTRDAVLLENFQ